MAEDLLSVAELFDEILPSAIANAPDAARRVGAVFTFKLTGLGGGTWTVDLKSAFPSVSKGPVANADVTIAVSVKDFLRMTRDPDSGTELFMKGRLRVTGDPTLAPRLQDLFSIAENELPRYRFRKELLSAYDRRCAVSNDGAERALQAAHIRPRKDEGGHDISNGILLRADLHQLFDCYQMTIHPETLIVVFSREALVPTTSSYAGLDGKQVRVPARDEHKPDRAALRARWTRRSWATERYKAVAR